MQDAADKASSVYRTKGARCTAGLCRTLVMWPLAFVRLERRKGGRPWPGPPKEAPQRGKKKSVFRRTTRTTEKRISKPVQHGCCPEGKCFSHFLLHGASMAVFTPGRPDVQVYRNILQPKKRHKPAITGTRAGGRPPPDIVATTPTHKTTEMGTTWTPTSAPEFLA